jgi:endonuclease/exonuclease/phosphatase family metal-dependent hydrolase
VSAQTLNTSLACGLLAPLVLGAGAPLPVEAPRTARVLTYNIEALTRGAGGVLATLKDANADVMALQEVDAGTARAKGVHQAKALGDALNMHATFAAAMPYDGGQYGLAVLSRQPMSLVAVHRLWQRGAEEPRIAMEVRTRVAGHNVTVINTHLTAHWRAEDPAGIRVQQAQDLARLLARLKGPVLLMGDFNCDPASAALQALFPQVQLVSQGVPTHPSEKPVHALDHVFARWPDALNVQPLARVPSDSLASDHLPLIWDLQIGGPPGVKR